MKKKLLSLALVAGLLAVLSTGCAPPPQHAAPARPPAPPAPLR